MSVIDAIQAKAQKEADDKRKRFLDQRNKFYENVTETQQKTGAGVYGKYSKEYTETKEGKIVKAIGKEKGYKAGDVREQAIREAEAKVEAERQYYRDQPKKSLTAGQRDEKTGKRTLSVTGERPAPPTEADISARLPAARERVKETRKQERQQGRPERVPSQDVVFQSYRELKKEAQEHGYDINRTKVKQYVKRGPSGELVEYTEAKSKYTPSKEATERDEREAKAKQDKLVQAEITKITGLPGFSGYNVTYDEYGTAKINYTIGNINQSSAIAAPVSTAQTEEEFFAEQRKQGLYYTGEKSVDPVTGETTYQFEDKRARDAALREQNTKEKVLKANAAYIGYKAEPEYGAGGEVVAYNFVPRKGAKQAEVFNAQGVNVTSEFLRGEIQPSQYSQLTFQTPEEQKVVEPNLGQQVYRATVGFGGETVAGLLDLAGEGEVRLYEALGGDKQAAQKFRESGRGVTKQIREKTSLDALGDFQIAVGEATGSKQYIYAGIESKRVAKNTPPPVIDPLVAAGGGVAAVFGSPEGKQIVGEFAEQTAKRPLETGITTVIDVVTLGGAGLIRAGGGAGETAGVAGRVGKTVKVAKAKTDTIGVRYGAEKNVTTNKLLREVDNAEGYKSKITPDLDESVRIESNVNYGEIRPTVEGDVIVKRPGKGGSGGGYGKDEYGGYGGGAKSEKGYGEGGAKVEKTESGATYTYSNKEGSLLLEQGVKETTATEAAAAVDETAKPINYNEVPEGYVPPEEQVSQIPEGIVPPEEAAALNRPIKIESKSERTKRIKKEKVDKVRLNQKPKVVKTERGGILNITKLKGRGRSLQIERIRRLGKGKQIGIERTRNLQERQTVLENLQKVNQTPKLKPEQVRITVPAVSQVPKQGRKTVPLEGFRFGSAVKTDTAVITKTGQGFKTDTKQVTRTTPKTVPKEVPFNVPRRIPRVPLLPRGGGGSGSILGTKRSGGLTDISSLAVANVLAPGFSIKGTGEQSKGAERLLALSVKPRKKGKKRKKALLDIL